MHLRVSEEKGQGKSSCFHSLWKQPRFFCRPLPCRHSTAPHDAWGAAGRGSHLHAPSCSLCDYQDEQQKIRFLRSICTLCKCKDTSLNLDAFCRENRLAANVQVGR